MSSAYNFQVQEHYMQESNPKKLSGSLSVQTGARLPSPSQNLLSQFYSFDEEKTPKVDRSEPSIRSPASATQAKDIQVQLEINQSKLNSLAKKIDQCLSASKTTYTTAQVMQPSESSLETSSLEENKEVKAPEQAIQDFKPEEQNEEANLSPNVSNGIMKSYRASMDTTTEEIVMSLGVSKKSVENLKKNNVQQKEKIAQNSSPAPKPTQTPQKANSKAPVQKSTRPSSTQKPAGSLQSSDIQKKLDTVSSVMIETGEDVPTLPKGKEKVPPLKQERRANNYSTSSKTPQKEEGSLSARSRPEKPDVRPGVAKKTSPQPRPTVNQTKVPASSVAEVEKTKTNTNLDKQNEHKATPKSIGKTLSPVKTEPKVQPVNKQTPKNTAVSAEKKTNVINEDKKTAPVIKPKTTRPSVPTTKNEPLKKASVPVVMQEKLQPSSSRKSTGVMRFPEECIVGDLEAIRMISPVSHDTKSSKGIYDFSTPGYNFDSPQHNNPNNLSINDSKNLSFESSLFGKDTSAAKMDNLQVRRKSGFSTEQNKPKEALKRNNSVKHEKLTTDEDLEANFTKAFTARKNRVINDLPDFESRLDSDLYYRRRFRVDLQNFLDENKSKLTEEQTERLIDRLVDDGNRRKVKAQKVELYNEKGYKESKNSTPVMSEDRLNQTFERLVSDAKKRLLLQEEQERIKALKQQEMDKKIERERSQKKMSKESEEKMVSKFVAEADRRRIQYEKTQIAKQEEEIRQANELQAQGFKPKSSNKAKSKIKEYINSKTETSLELSERRNRSQKSLLKDDKSRTPSPVEIMPTIQEKPLTTDRKPVTPKKKYLSIPSPKGKAAEAFKKISKESPKNNSISSLEHLQTLRKNINKHKNEIEEHLYNLKEIDTDSQVRTLTTSPERNPQFVSKRPEPIKTASPKKDKDSTLSTKVTSKYDHIESKVAKHIETKYIKQQDQSLADEKSKEARELPRTSLTSPKTLNNTKEGLVKQAKNEKEEIKSKGHSHNQSKFMSDRAAMSFVEKLINEFKMSKNT